MGKNSTNDTPSDDHDSTTVGSHSQIEEDLATLALIWVGVFVCNLISKRLGVSALVLHLVLGCLYVNFGLLPEHPSAFLASLSELAITIVMFSLGLEENVKNFIQGIKKAWGIALIGAIGPFINGFGVGTMFYDQVSSASVVYL